MTTFLPPVRLPEVDDPPRSGVFIDPEEFVPTAEEIAEGNRLGQVIDVDDDEDNGVGS